MTFFAVSNAADTKVHLTGRSLIAKSRLPKTLLLTTFQM